MENKFIISGNMARDAMLNRNGDKVSCFFTVGVNRAMGGADFISVKAFKSLAESINKSLKKGDNVEVEGHIATSSYEKNGQKMYSTDLIADKVRKLPRGEGRGETAVEVVNG